MTEEFAAALDAAIFKQASHAARIESAITSAAIALERELTVAGVLKGDPTDLVELTKSVGGLARPRLAALTTDGATGNPGQRILDEAKLVLTHAIKERLEQ